MTTEDIAELVSSHPVFAGLPGDTHSLVAGCAHNVAFAAGEHLLREGEPADAVYLLRRGRVSLESQVPGREPGRRHFRPRAGRWVVVAVPALPLALRRPLHRASRCYSGGGRVLQGQAGVRPDLRLRAGDALRTYPAGPATGDAVAVVRPLRARSRTPLDLSAAGALRKGAASRPRIIGNLIDNMGG